jgi:hypothetical protein
MVTTRLIDAEYWYKVTYKGKLMRGSWNRFDSSEEARLFIDFNKAEGHLTSDYGLIEYSKKTYQASDF